MSFKLVHSNKNGTFKIELNRDLSSNEIMDLCQLATNLVPCEEASSSIVQEYPFRGPVKVYGPSLPTDGAIQSSGINDTQTRLGQFPKEKINLGDYVPPSGGENFRIKMVSLVETNKVPVFKIFRDETGISLMGCKEVLYGNYPCPPLPLDKAQRILEKFREYNVFAKIVQA